MIYSTVYGTVYGSVYGTVHYGTVWYDLILVMNKYVTKEILALIRIAPTMEPTRLQNNTPLLKAGLKILKLVFDRQVEYELLLKIFKFRPLSRCNQTIFSWRRLLCRIIFVFERQYCPRNSSGHA